MAVWFYFQQILSLAIRPWPTVSGNRHWVALDSPTCVPSPLNPMHLSLVLMFSGGCVVPVGHLLSTVLSAALGLLTWHHVPGHLQLPWLSIWPWVPRVAIAFGSPQSIYCSCLDHCPEFSFIQKPLREPGCPIHLSELCYLESTSGIIPFKIEHLFVSTCPSHCYELWTCMVFLILFLWLYAWQIWQPLDIQILLLSMLLVPPWGWEQRYEHLSVLSLKYISNHASWLHLHGLQLLGHHPFLPRQQ